MWCTFADDDDLWHPDRSLEYVKAITSQPQQVAAAAFATTSRADVVMLEKLGNLAIPDDAAEVDTFLKSSEGHERSLDPEFLDWPDGVTITLSLQIANN